MDFDETPEEAAFRAEVRAFLDDHAELRRKGEATSPYQQGGRVSDDAELDHVEACRRWQRTLHDNGWAGITWPKEYGGRGGTGVQQGIFNREQARYAVPTGVFAVGIGMVGPTLIAHGTEDQKRRFLDGLLRGDHVWCQLFSEPGAGSDLAGLGTTAVRDGDEWVVSGQKVWTSGAQNADYGILLARTDPDQPKHRGISYFIVDMTTPGIEVRPLVQITGAAHFNEVFLDEVRIPADGLVGEVDGGWGVAQTTLMNERTLIGGGGGGAGLGWPDILELARSAGRTEDRVVRQELARCYTRLQLSRFLGYRVQTATSQGRMPGPESSVMKLGLSQHSAATGDLVLALSGASGVLDGADARQDGIWQKLFLGQWGIRIGGGTDQVQRNIIGERVLGLPPEPRADKGVPWREVPRSA